MNPTNDEVNDTLRRLEQTKMEIVDNPDDTPPWVSDAEREGLPTVNRTTGSGAPLLRTDDVLKWEPEHLGRKA